jgi:hypothetical protein
MVEATANTTVSTAGIWAIVIVASLALAFWLIMIFLADRSQVRASGPGPSVRGAWVGGSVAGERAEQVPDEAVHEPIGTQGRQAQDESVPQGEMPTRDDLPAQPHAMPRQRAGEADRAARSHAGPGRPDDENPRAGEAGPGR